MGQYYCLHCDRYFADLSTRDEHFKTKRHKKRLKEMMGTKPHTQLDADLAAGMGMPDNGPKLMSMLFARIQPWLIGWVNQDWESDPSSMMLGRWPASRRMSHNVEDTAFGVEYAPFGVEYAP
ncbi:hypothetical protein Patl1_32186 [Pistacia atlantica]|uniref:Uncharacterized protein n=1 Tax=Pistacia atlantica TaxID=434234 RepID=A0ACC1AN96_9ROSI|nr:hypothetical protein Patl1_32186 [Pistacia atlantica]